MPELHKNNKLLIELIYSKQEFSEKELFDEFYKQRNGDVAIEGTLTIRDFLGELTDFGVLSHENGQYSLIKKRQQLFFQ